MADAIRIAELNDEMRKAGGPFTVTQGVQALSRHDQMRLWQMVRDFSDFRSGDNPYGERDFGAVDMDNTVYYWKIDYYDSELEGGSEDPANPDITKRILTIMRADEY